MKFYKFNLIAAFLIICLINACVVKKPDTDAIGNPDYNTRRSISNPHYHKKLSGWGISSIVGGAIAGGTAGYFANMITYQKGESRISVKPANAVIGAVVGVSIVSLINYAAGLNKRYDCDDKIKWTKKANKNYLFLEDLGYHNFTVINKNAESNYIVKNFKDAKDFSKVFTDSKYADDIVRKSIPVVSRDQLLDILYIFPRSNELNSVKLEYIKQSPNISELIYAKSKFPEIQYNIEQLATNLISNLSDVKTYVAYFPNGEFFSNVELKSIDYVKGLNDIKDFKEIFPNSKYSEEVFKKSLSYISRNEIPQLINLFPTLNAVKEAKDKYLNKSATLSECIEASAKYPELYANAEQSALTFIKTYKDASAFNKAYPNSALGNQIQLQIINNITKDEVLNLIEMYPNTNCLPQLKSKYIEMCFDIDDCIKAKTLFPYLNKQINNKAASLVENIDDFKKLKGNFLKVSDTLLNNSFSQVLKNCNKDEIPTLINLLPKSIYVITAKNKYIELCSSIDDFYKLSKIFPEYKTKAINKAKDILSNKSSIADCYNVAKGFPDMKTFADNKAFTLVENTDDCNSYKQYFPYGKHISEVNNKLLKDKKDNFEYYTNQAEDDILKNNFSNALTNINNAKTYSSGSANDKKIISRLVDLYAQLNKTSGNNQSSNSNSDKSIPDGFTAARCGSFAKKFAKLIEYENEWMGNFVNESFSIKKWDVIKGKDGTNLYRVYVEFGWREQDNETFLHLTKFDYLYKGAMIFDEFGCFAFFLCTYKEEPSLLGVGKRTYDFTDKEFQKNVEKYMCPGALYWCSLKGCIDDE